MLLALDPKSSVSTNSTKGAGKGLTLYCSSKPYIRSLTIVTFHAYQTYPIDVLSNFYSRHWKYKDFPYILIVPEVGIEPTLSLLTIGF